MYGYGDFEKTPITVPHVLPNLRADWQCAEVPGYSGSPPNHAIFIISPFLYCQLIKSESTK